MWKTTVACSVAVALLLPLCVGEVLADSPYSGAVKFWVHESKHPGTVRLYRLQLADGSHVYTTSEFEVTALTKSTKYQAKVEPMAMFVYTEQKPGTVRLYRFTQKQAGGWWRAYYTAFEPEMKEVRRQKSSDLHSMKAFVFPHDYRPTEFVLQAGRATTPDVEDVTLCEGQQHPSRGRETIISSNYDGITLIRFDVSRVPAAGTVKTATLELYCNSVGFAEEEIERTSHLKVFRFCHDWKEGTGTADVVRRDGANVRSFDGQSPWPEGGAKACAGELLATFAHKGNYRDRCRWSLKPDVVQEWMSPARPNYGLMIQGTPGAKALCYPSSDAQSPEKRPILRLTLAYSDDIVPVYRCHNPATGENFYTTSQTEKESFTENAKRQVALMEKQVEEREQRKVADAANSTRHERSTPKTGAEKLALLYLGKPVSKDQAVVARFDELIRKIQAKCAPIDAETVAAVTHTAHTLLKEKGVKIDLLELLEWLEKSAPKRHAGPYKYQDIAIAFVGIAVSHELKHGELPKVQTYVRAMLEELAGPGGTR